MRERTIVKLEHYYNSELSEVELFRINHVIDWYNIVAVNPSVTNLQYLLVMISTNWNNGSPNSQYMEILGDIYFLSLKSFSELL